MLRLEFSLLLIYPSMMNLQDMNLNTALVLDILKISDTENN